MLLDAKWKPEIQCFVKVSEKIPHTYQYFARDGRELEGEEWKRKHKLALASAFQTPVFSNQSVFSPALTARHIQNKMLDADLKVNELLHKAEAEAVEHMAKTIDDHLLDSLMYGVGVLHVPQDTIKWKTKFEA